MNTLQFYEAQPTIKVALAAGGTGGHVIPALALAEHMREGLVAGMRFIPEVLLGCRGGMEEKLAAAEKLPFIGLPKPKAVGLKAKLQAPFRLGAAVYQAGRILKQMNIDIVVGFGGYASAAPLIAAWLAGIPTVLCEQNALPGRTNRTLARFASLVVGQFDECAPYFPRKCQVETLGNPLRKAVRDLVAQRDAQRSAGAQKSSNGTTLLVMGGSQGAQPINQMVFAALPALKTRVADLRLIHLTGDKETLQIAERCAELGIPARVMPFHSEMNELYRETDFVVARSGATSLAELTALGLPMALIPFPQAMDDHQTYNARSIAKTGAAFLWPQADLTPETFAKRLSAALSDRVELEKMKFAARNCGQPDSGLRILVRIADIVYGEHAVGEQHAA